MVTLCSENTRALTLQIFVFVVSGYGFVHFEGSERHGIC